MIFILFSVCVIGKMFFFFPALSFSHIFHGFIVFVYIYNLTLVGLHHRSKEGVKGRGASGSKGGAGCGREGAEAEDKPDTRLRWGRGHSW